MADGVIFLTEYARDKVLDVTGHLRAKTCIIPHGINPRFSSEPKEQRAIAEYSNTVPYRVIYVSIIDQYKHQWHVVDAIAALRQQGLPVVLDLVGPANPQAINRLVATIARADATGSWVHYHGAIKYTELHDMYAAADLGIWASTCETFGIILLETMAAGLPIACSNIGATQEIVGDAGIYFEPEQPADIVRALQMMLASPQLRSNLAHSASRRAHTFSWPVCAKSTFQFLSMIAISKINVN